MSERSALFRLVPWKRPPQFVTMDDGTKYPADLFPKRYGYTLPGLLAACLQQRCSVEHDHIVTRFDRWRFTAKAVICLLLRREGKRVYCAYPGPDHIEVACLDSRSGSGPDGTWYSWDGVAVAMGWRYWRVEVFSDGAP